MSSRPERGQVGARRVVAAFFAALVVLVAPSAWAHKPSDSYLVLKRAPDGFDARWDIALRDVDDAIGLVSGDAHGAKAAEAAAAADARDRTDSPESEVRWSDIEAQQSSVARWAFGSLAFRAGTSSCTVTPDASRVALTEHSDGSYLVLRASVRCPDASDVRLKYDLLFDIDAQHRGIVRIEDGDIVTVLVASADRRSLTLPLASAPSGRGWFAQSAAMVREGVGHILSGYDHLLFLIALLLPSVLLREDKSWRPRETFRSVVLDVAKIVTAFTIAHSITLALAGLGLVTLPSRLVESTIAASVMVVALNNLRPFLPLERWSAAFALGLMHGFGFSSALADVGAHGGAMLATLFGFNLGVELGQLAVVAVLLPVAFALRARRFYTPVVLRLGSLAIFCAASLWFVQRIRS